MKKEQVKRGFMRFFLTEKGRNVVFVGACCTTIGLFVGNFVPHTLGLKYYQEFVQSYKNGIARPVSEKVKRRVEAAVDKLEVHDYERTFIKPFTVYGFDLFQAGSTKYRFGAMLGIPNNYNYASVNDIKHNEIRFRNQEIDWNSPTGRLLEDALVLSDDEQVFGLCKSILQLQTHRVLLNSIFPSVSFLMVYTIGHYFNARLDLFARPLSMRMVLYTILGLFGVGTWSFLKDYNQVKSDAEIDKQLSSMGPEFIQAGIQFYDKQLKKNMALRTLIGDDTYTALGNENYLFRQKSMPLTIRKSFFEEKWKELKKGSQEETEVQ